MTGATRRRDPIAAGMAALLLVALGVMPAAAADPPALDLPGQTFAALVVDLDDDGVRDLLRLTGTRDAFEVEAWTYRAGWRSESAAVPRVTKPASPERRSPMATLLQLRRGGTAGALLVLGGPNDEAGWAACCLEAWWIDLVDGRLILEDRGSLPGHAVSVNAFDGDADGTDEIALVNEREDPALTRATVLSHAGDRFEALAGVRIAGSYGGTYDVETDGRPGAELLFGPNAEGVLQRLTLDAARAPVVEDARVPGAQSGTDPTMWLAAVSRDRLVLQTDRGLMVARWPEGGTLTELRTLEGAWVYSQLSRGDREPMLLVSTDGSSRLRVLDVTTLDLAENTSLSVDGSTQPEWMTVLNASGVLDNAQLYPHSGEIPGGLAGGVAAAVIDGRLLTADRAGVVRTESVAPLMGLAPVGTIGPDQAWIAVARNPWHLSSGGWMAELGAQGTKLIVAPVAAVLRPSGAQLPRIEVAGDAVELEDDVLATAGTSVLVDLAAPVGSRAFVVVNGSLRSGETMRAEREMRIAEPRRMAEGATRFLVTVGVVTPLGAVTARTWDVRLMHEPPTVDVADATLPLALASRVRGTAPGAAVVTVDGIAVPVAADGSFVAEVFAPPWPRDVLVSVTDIVGNRSVKAISAIGIYDYRWVPFPILVAVALGMVLVALFVTAGRRRPQAVPGGSNLGTWEELDPGTLIVRGEGPEPHAPSGRRRW